MDGEEGSGIRLSKRFADGKVTGGLEVDYKTKSGTAWSHSFLNQKPWHPLSYPNQRRKWIAEQTHAQHDRRAEEVAREVRILHGLEFPLLLIQFVSSSLHPFFPWILQFAQEQEFFKQAALISKKEREKVSFFKFLSQIRGFSYSDLVLSTLLWVLILRTTLFHKLPNALD